jgi:hypothetical protein
LPVIARFCLLLLASACYSVLLIVYLNVLDFSFKIKTTTFYFTSKVELVRQQHRRSKGSSGSLRAWGVSQKAPVTVW